MSSQAIAFMLFGATVLWGGFLVTLFISLTNK